MQKKSSMVVAIWSTLFIVTSLWSLWHCLFKIIGGQGQLGPIFMDILEGSVYLICGILIGKYNENARKVVVQLGWILTVAGLLGMFLYKKHNPNVTNIRLEELFLEIIFLRLLPVYFFTRSDVKELFKK